eukprot:15462120-Alexandrium_andersonii.AAC.1
MSAPPVRAPRLASATSAGAAIDPRKAKVHARACACAWAWARARARMSACTHARVYACAQVHARAGVAQHSEAVPKDSSAFDIGAVGVSPALAPSGGSFRARPGHAAQRPPPSWQRRRTARTPLCPTSR